MMRPVVAAAISVALHLAVLFAPEGLPVPAAPAGKPLPLRARLIPPPPPLPPRLSSPAEGPVVAPALLPLPKPLPVPQPDTLAPGGGLGAIWWYEPDPDPRFPYVQVRVHLPEASDTIPEGAELDGEFLPAVGLDALPTPLTRFPVPDPRAALQLPVRARWRLAVWLDELGQPLAVRTLEGEGPPPLRQAAEQALAQAAFQPPSSGGVPVRTRVDLVVEFGYDT